MNSHANSRGNTRIESFREALGKTLSERHIELLLLYLKEKGAIYQENEVDFEKLEEAMKELFGEGAVIFFELILKLENKVPDV